MLLNSDALMFYNFLAVILQTSRYIVTSPGCNLGDTWNTQDRASVRLFGLVQGRDGLGSARHDTEHDPNHIWDTGWGPGSKNADSY